jgi:concanavalin A-like lectin/glucanase superfamily protein
MSKARRHLVSALVVSSALPLLVLLSTPAQAAGVTVAQWHMDEPSGSTMLDGSGNGNDGAISNVALSQPGDPGVPSVFGYGFNGTNSIVTVPDAGSLDPGSQAFSFTVHVNFTALPPTDGDYDLIRKGLASTKGGDYKLEIYNRLAGGRHVGRASCRYHGVRSDGSKSSVLIQNGKVADGNWHTITCVKLDQQINMIIDGTKYTKSVGTIGSISNSAPLTVGAKVGLEDQYDGLMDEVSICVPSCA